MSGEHKTSEFCQQNTSFLKNVFPEFLVRILQTSNWEFLFLSVQDIQDRHIKTARVNFGLAGCLLTCGCWYCAWSKFENFKGCEWLQSWMNKKCWHMNFLSIFKKVANLSTKPLSTVHKQSNLVDQKFVKAIDRWH